MKKATYNDLVVVRQYFQEITTFIEAIVKDEVVAAVLACEVFMEYQKKAALQSFESEENKAKWLRDKSRQLAEAYLKRNT